MDKSNDTYRNYARIVLLTVPFIPLVVVNSFIFPFVTGKALAFFLLIEVALVLLIMSFRTRFVLSLSVLPVLIACFFALLLLATFMSENFHISFWSDVERMGGLFTWIHLVLFFAGTSILFGEKDWHSFFKLSLLVSSVVSFLGIAQRNGTIPLLNEEGRVDVLFGNPTFLSLYLLLHIGIGLILFTRSRSSHVRVALGFSLGAHLIVLFYTGTRGTLLAFLGAVAVGSFVYAVHASIPSRIRYVCIGAIAMIMIMVGSLLFFNDQPWIASQPVLERFSVISLSNIENQARYYIWEAALDGILERPVWGSGFEGFTTIFSKYAEPSYFGENLTSLPEPWVDRAHNVFLDVSSSTGIPSLLLFLTIGLYTLYIFYSTNRISNAERSIFIAVIAGYVIHSLFSFNTLTDSMFLLAFVSYASSLDSNLYVKEFSLQRSSLLAVKVVCLSVVILGMILSGNRMLFLLEARAVLDRTTDDISARFFGYAALSKERFVDRHYLFYELPFLGTRLLPINSVSEKEKIIETVRFAEASYWELGTLSIKNLYFFGKFYRMSGAYADANRLLTKAHDRAPQNQLVLIELGKLALVEGNYEKALTHLERAYLLEPTFEDAVVSYATALAYAGHIVEADAIIAKYFGDGVKATDKIMGIN